MNVRVLAERVAGLDRLVQVALQSSQEAITKAETATEKRFDAVNEFRATLSDQASTFATKEKVDGSVEALNTRMDGLERAVSRLLIALLTSIVAVLVSALVLVATR
jgi:hypothetical protein